MQRFCMTMARLLVFAFLVLVFAQPTGATTAVMLLDTDLIVHSRFIVSGRVISLTTDRDGSRSMAWTYVEVRTDRVLKGDLHDGTIVLKQLGGTVGESGVASLNNPHSCQGNASFCISIPERTGACILLTISWASSQLSRMRRVQNSSNARSTL